MFLDWKVSPQARGVRDVVDLILDCKIELESLKIAFQAQSISLKYEPSSEPLHISAKQLSSIKH